MAPLTAAVTPPPRRSWEEHLVSVGGLIFRPVSAGTLAMLYEVDSPLVFGGKVSGEDFALFAWIHHAPVERVRSAIASGKAKTAALEWFVSAPVEVFALMSAERVKQLAADVQAVFADRKTGYIPFPLPSLSRHTWRERALTTITRLFGRG